MTALGLHGADWLAYLDARAPGRFAALGEALTESPYRPPGAGDDVARLTAELRTAARGWLRAVL